MYDKVGGISTNYKLAGDFDLWMRFSRHEKMFISNALIGGFRHSSNQLSDDLERYMAEVEDIIAKEPISKEEKKQIKKLNTWPHVLFFLQKFKILNWQSIDLKYRRYYIEEEKRHRIYYDFVKKIFTTQ